MAKVKYRYCCEYDEELINSLRNHDIKCEMDDICPTTSNRLFVFCIYEHEMTDENLKKLIEMHQITCFTSLQFTKKEMMTANWFSMWCNYSKIEPAYGTSPFEYQCEYEPNRARHRKQVSPYVLKKTFNWGNHNFVSELGTVTELFINSRAKKIFSDFQIKGLQYSPVYRVRNELQCEDIFQIVPGQVLPCNALELIESDSCTLFVCPQCGRKQYHTKGHYRLKVKQDFLSEESDIYFTEELFGAGFGQRKIIVSRKFYQTVQENGLGRNLIFEPILLF